MKESKYYLITCKGINGKRFNIAIAKDLNKVKQIVSDFKDREAKYKSIPDFKALNILLNDFGCLKAF